MGVYQVSKIGLDPLPPNRYAIAFTITKDGYNGICHSQHNKSAAKQYGLFLLENVGMAEKKSLINFQGT